MPTERPRSIILVVFILMVMGLVFFVIESEDYEYTQIDEELRQNSTDYLFNEMNSSLSAIECSGQKYSVDSKEQNICFECGLKKACFGYSEVERSGGTKYNKADRIFLEGFFSPQEEFNFYSAGISDALNCQYENRSRAVCQKGIELYKYQNNATKSLIAELPDELNTGYLISEIERNFSVECEDREAEIFTKYNCGELVFEYLNPAPKYVNIQTGLKT